MLFLIASLLVSDVPAWVAKADELWLKRDQAEATKELTTLLKGELDKDGQSVEALVRRAMQQCWMADGMGDGSQLKAQLGKNCWETAEKAIAVDAGDVRAQYWATVGIGLYSEGVGILTALSEGLEGKFRGHVEAAIKADPAYLKHSPAMLYGRFYFKLPWPKRDLDKSLALIEETIKAQPTNLLARAYLADTLFALGRDAEAKKAAEEVLAASANDPQDRRSQTKAKKILDAHK